MKRKITILVVIVMLVVMALPISSKAARVVDISNHWASTTIQLWIDEGFISGYPDGRFRPDNYISRAEFVTMINKVYNYTAKNQIGFSDVHVGDWYYNAISIARAAGYLNGYPDNTVKPKDPITREEAASMLVKIANLETNSTAANIFKDAYTMTWSKSAIGAVVLAKIMVGYDDGTFKANNYITRGEAVVSLDRAAFPGDINIKNYGAVGNGTVDDTAAINKVIKYVSERGGGSVIIPDGTYLINPITKIRMRSNVNLELSKNAILKSMPTSSDSYDIIRLWQVSNIDITGGKIIGDRATHIGVSGEWGFGISMWGCSDIYIADITITDCWGDGIYIGSAVNSKVPSVMYCENVLIERVYINNCRRDNISVISAKNLVIRDSVLSNAKGNIAPEAGLNFEPNYPNEFLQNIVIENLQTYNNGGFGIQLGYTMRRLQTPVDITIINHTDSGSLKPIGPWPLGEFEATHVKII